MYNEMAEQQSIISRRDFNEAHGCPDTKVRSSAKPTFYPSDSHVLPRRWGCLKLSAQFVPGRPTIAGTYITNFAA
jgi:hypothetical protein